MSLVRTRLIALLQQLVIEIAICPEQLTNQYCNIASHYCITARKRTSCLTRGYVHEEVQSIFKLVSDVHISTLLLVVLCYEYKNVMDSIFEEVYVHMTIH